MGDLIIGAFTFRKGVYRQVEADANFTGTAWLIVVVVSFLNQLGASASSNVAGWIGGAVVGTIFIVMGFAVSAYIISLVGRTLFKADVSFEEMVRTLGLAYVWNVLGFVGVLAGFSGALVCVLAPALIVGGILGFIAWLVATKEALDIGWLETIVTVIVGVIVLWVFSAIAGGVLRLFGLSRPGFGGLRAR